MIFKLFENVKIFLKYRESMVFYRGIYEREQEEELESIMVLAKQNDAAKGMRVGDHLCALTSAGFLRPFQCVGVLYLLYALSGVHIISNYTLTFLEVSLLMLLDVLDMDVFLG